MTEPITYIVQNQIVEKLIQAYGVNPVYKDDLIQEVYLILLEYDKQLLQTLIDNNQVKFYIARIIRNQYFSKTSTFYKLFKKYYSIIDDNANLLNDETTEPTQNPDE